MMPPSIKLFGESIDEDEVVDALCELIDETDNEILSKEPSVSFSESCGCCGRDQQ